VVEQAHPSTEPCQGVPEALEHRSAVLQLEGAAKPDMASLTLGSLNFPGQPSINAPETIQQLCAIMRDRDIMPELEVFDLGMLNYGFYLQRKGLLPKDCYVNLMLGSLGTIPGRVLDLAHLVREIPRGWTWAGGGIGRYQLAVNTASIVMGGHVRVGLEDNPLFDHVQRTDASNEQLVRRLVRLAAELGRPIATPAYVRSRLRLGDPGNWAATRALVRKMSPSDLEPALAILAKWNMAPISPSAEIPDPERNDIDLPNSFVAELEGRVIGIASYLVQDTVWAETCGLAVDPDYLGCGVGHLLQQARLDEIKTRGLTRVRTEADRPEVIDWYQETFGYRRVGSRKKKAPYLGLPDRDHWTVQELRLDSAD
jgi:GNAT superfamily N-acetyltransferase